MKKRIILATVTLALSLPWVGCKKTPQSEWSKPATQAAPAGPVELKFKWPVGGHLVQGFEISNHSEIFVPSMPNPMEQDMNMEQRYALTVTKEREGGGREVEMEFLSTRMAMTMAGQAMMNFDSTKKSKEDAKNPTAAVFDRLNGSRIRYLLDASNHVETVLGLDDLRKKVMSGANNDPSGMASSMFSEDYMKQFMDGAWSLPAKPVQPGDTWTVQREMVMGPLGSMNMDYTYTFKGWELRDQHHCARLGFDGTITGKPGGISMPGAMSATIEDGKSSGDTWFDPERGVSVETIMDQTMKMRMTVPGGGRGGAAAPAQTMTISNYMTMKIIVKLESAK